MREIKEFLKTIETCMNLHGIDYYTMPDLRLANMYHLTLTDAKMRELNKILIAKGFAEKVEGEYGRGKRKSILSGRMCVAYRLKNTDLKSKILLNRFLEAKPKKKRLAVKITIGDNPTKLPLGEFNCYTVPIKFYSKDEEIAEYLMGKLTTKDGTVHNVAPYGFVRSDVLAHIKEALPS